MAEVTEVKITSRADAWKAYTETEEYKRITDLIYDPSVHRLLEVVFTEGYVRAMERAVILTRGAV